MKVLTLTFTGLLLVLALGLLLLHQIAVPGLLGISFVVLFVGLVAVIWRRFCAGDATEMVKERPRRFKYTWMRTAEDRAEDYSAFDGTLIIGRVYRLKSTTGGGWWSGSQAALEWHGLPPRRRRLHPCPGGTMAASLPRDPSFVMMGSSVRV